MFYEEKSIIAALYLSGVCTLIGCNYSAKTNEEITNVVEADSDDQIFSMTSEDGNTIVNVIASKDSGYLQSGTFKYIISKQEFDNLQQNEPQSVG